MSENIQPGPAKDPTKLLTDIQDEMILKLNRNGVTYTIISFGLALLASTFGLSALNLVSETHIIYFSISGIALTVIGAIVAIFSATPSTKRLKSSPFKGLPGAGTLSRSWG